ncbi:methionyl-tRNA formyltransferase [Anaerococcus lactolyticus ATCC 51172]|uniref:Methionyl-tRNA formyltransferase n=1 Tax=Anaerococcus lactolyticus ATCC 51172 TaxID=525254 RepID=C2BCI6_9FIRM|nr:methionyl-tRNA formyltransferase [Anaerococcus lactolyticus]EEI87388.1 methionyl-tRNA formyltransferase [Anaerococcus lactolyticus ATCC 51172]
MINICFMGNPKFALQTLDILYRDENINLKLVVSGKDKKRSRNKFSPTPVKKYAEDNGIRVETPDSVNTEEFLDLLKDLEIDYIVVVAFGQLIKKIILDGFKDRIINLHPSLLPLYRGASPMQFTLLNGDKKTAATVMLIEKGMDSGDILIQREMDVDPSDDYFDLEDKLGKIGAEAIRDAILNFDEVYENRLDQDDEKATYCTKIDKEMGKIDWNKSSREILDQIRALVGFPVAYFDYKGENVKVHKASLADKKGQAGEILAANKKDKLIIGTSDGSIRIEKIQFPGKKAMDTTSFLLGNDVEVGFVLENE